jgi:hypothetical protein
MYLLILIMPVFSLTLLKLKNNKYSKNVNSEKLRHLLFSFQGVALGFWMFDIATTFYAINITGLAIELNPLGWPWGILGAFAFFGPALMFSYVLLFKMKEKILVRCSPTDAIDSGYGLDESGCWCPKFPGVR